MSDRTDDDADDDGVRLEAPKLKLLERGAVDEIPNLDLAARQRIKFALLGMSATGKTLLELYVPEKPTDGLSLPEIVAALLLLLGRG